METCLNGEAAFPLRRLRMTASGRLDGQGLLGDPSLRRLLALLNPVGEETRIVGGAVRNALLGVPPGDIDLATTLPPDAVMRHAKAARLRAIPTGIAHGTVTILAGRQPFEVTTLREDVETDGRHAVVRFGRDFTLDARRRDFTMNALSLGPDGTIFDAVGGLDDLAHGHVRFIGEAATRIREDYLRILRFFRFHATYGIGPLDAEGLAAVTAHRDGLARLSRERVRAEFFKILVAPGAMAVLNTMHINGILDAVLPGTVDLGRLGRLVATSGDAADATLRLAAVAVPSSNEIEPLREALRLTNVETKRLAGILAASHALTVSLDAPDEASLRRLLFEHGREACADALRLEGAPDDVLAFVGDAPIPRFPFGGADLMRRGVNGPALGRMMTRLRSRWAGAGFPTDPATLEGLLEDTLSDQATS